MAEENVLDNVTTPMCSEMRGFIAEQSIFSHDSSLLFLYSGNLVLIHSVETGECICSLKGHRAAVVSLIINPLNQLQLISMDKYGTIKIWDYLRCACVDSIDLASILELEKGPTYSSLTGCKSVTSSTKSMDKHLFIYCIVNQQHIIAINLKTKQIRPIIYNVARRRDVKGDEESFQNLSISNDGSYLSAIMQREIIIIHLNEDTHDLHLVSYKTHGWKLSKSLAFHPHNELLAFGDARGAIHLWHGFVSLFMKSSNWNLSFLQNAKKHSKQSQHKTANKSWQTVREWLEEFPSSNDNKERQHSETKTHKKRATKTTEQRYLIKKIHWHSHMVKSIAFTTDGAYMLSGGEESVLVLTQLETSRQQFLPRLGGCITHLAVSHDEIKFGVCLKSNRIRIVDSINNKIVKTIEGIGICHEMEPQITQYHQRFSCNPRNITCFALPSLPGTIQFYDLNKDKSRGTLQLVQYPLISRMQQKHPDRYTAEFMQFNQDGTRLITVIKRTTHSILGLNDEDIEMDETENCVNLVTLQIWHYHTSNNQFVLNTRIDAPHHANSIRGIVFHPNKNRFVSYAHNDNNFKIWDECNVTKYLKPKKNRGDSGDIQKVLTTFSAKKHMTWKSLMSGYYRKDPVSAAQFSADGTILFIAAGTMLTLWNASNLMLLKKVEQLNIVRSMETFNHLPYLLTVNDGAHDDAQCDYDDVNIWDLVQFNKYWSVKQMLDIKHILDVALVPFKHKLKASHSLFLIACQLSQSEDKKHLILCDMQNKEILHQWLLPKDIEIKRNSMIIQPHNANKQILKRILKNMKNDSICEKDIDVVFITKNGPVRIPCLYTQWKHKQCGTKDIDIVDNNAANNDDAVTKYLSKISGNDSIFERIFGSKGLQSKPVDKEELERQRESTRQRLAKLTPSARAKSNVVDDIFSGAAHTLPPIDDLFEKYMSYFIEPRNREEEKHTEQTNNSLDGRRVGNSNVILDEIKTDTRDNNGEQHASEDIDLSMLLKEDKDEESEHDDDDDEDFEMDETDFERLRSIVMTPIDLNALKSNHVCNVSSNKKNIKKKKSKSNNKKQHDSDEKQSVNGMLSSFWSLRKMLTENERNGIKSFKMNGLRM